MTASPEPPAVERESAEPPSKVDELAAVPREYPPGAPALRPLMQLGFRQRAKAMRAYATLEPTMRSFNDQQQSDGARVDLTQAAAIFEMFAQVDDLLTLCALDPERYRVWVDQASDDQFMELFSIFMERTQPGEAQPSPS